MANPVIHCMSVGLHGVPARDRLIKWQRDITKECEIVQVLYIMMSSIIESNISSVARERERLLADLS